LYLLVTGDGDLSLKHAEVFNL